MEPVGFLSFLSVICFLEKKQSKKNVLGNNKKGYDAFWQKRVIGLSEYPAEASPVRRKVYSRTQQPVFK